METRKSQPLQGQIFLLLHLGFQLQFKPTWVCLDWKAPSKCLPFCRAAVQNRKFDSQYSPTEAPLVNGCLHWLCHGSEAQRICHTPMHCKTASLFCANILSWFEATRVFPGSLVDHLSSWQKNIKYKIK